MDLVKKYFNIFQKHILQSVLLLMFFLLVLYLFSDNFRCFLLVRNIDPNFIIGFFTIIALLLSSIQNLHDRRYAYNLKIVESIEDKGLFVISKLIQIIDKSHKCKGTTLGIKEAIKSGKTYEDTNDIFSRAIEAQMELAATYIDTYFPALKEDWNNLLENKLSEIATICSNILLNYNKNINLLNQQNFRNDALDNIDQYCLKVTEIDESVNKITLKIRDTIIEKINLSKEQIKKSFNFQL